MGVYKSFLYLFMLMIGLNSVCAATLHGTIYDLSLKKVIIARVEINTSTNQIYIAQNGAYSFDVPEGFYSLKAFVVQKNVITDYVEENITIKEAGSYVLDLILFPEISIGDFDNGVEINESLFESSNENKSNDYLWVLFFVIILIAFIAYFFAMKNKKNKKEPKDDDIQKSIEKQEEKYEDGNLEQVINIIKQEGGRTTQKDIRKQIPLSEAKISLMIAELEHKGVIEKIKKGRGNIIILKKK